MKTTELATGEESAAVSGRRFRHEPHPSPAGEDVRRRIVERPKFGQHFSDHMAVVDWSADAGWRDPRVVPLAPLSMHPATAVLHYGQEVFEGLKVYRNQGGQLRAFRPELNALRLQRSAQRLALPVIPEDVFLDSIDALISADREWVPGGEGESLYLRPFIIATEVFLGVRAAKKATYCVIASPAGRYFDNDADGVSLWLSTTHSRAGRGGTGAAKCGGNYASSLAAQLEAQAHGCDQVLFTDAATSTWVEEAGSMNIFFVLDGVVITPPTDGTILAGVTRTSILELADELGYATEVRQFGIQEWADAAASGSLTEVFASGTAAVVTPIRELVSDTRTIATPMRGVGPVAARLRDQLTGIQFGTLPDRFGWMRTVGERP